MGKVLVAWDGSSAAARALAVAAEELAERDATILHVSQSMVDWAFAPALGPLLRMPDVDAAILTRATSVVQEGVALADRLGFTAIARVETTGKPAWHAILEVAKDEGSTIIVAGSHGHAPALGGLLGSTASGLVQRSPIPVLVVPAVGRGE